MDSFFQILDKSVLYLQKSSKNNFSTKRRWNDGNSRYFWWKREKTEVMTWQMLAKDSRSCRKGTALRKMVWEGVPHAEAVENKKGYDVTAYILTTVSYSSMMMFPRPQRRAICFPSKTYIAKKANR